VSLGRHDTVCWACRHAIQPPRVYSAKPRLLPILMVVAVVVLAVFLVRYRSQLGAVIHLALRALSKPH
jgi:hypothetical protein